MHSIPNEDNEEIGMKKFIFHLIHCYLILFICFISFIHFWFESLFLLLISKCQINCDIKTKQKNNKRNDNNKKTSLKKIHAQKERKPICINEIYYNRKTFQKLMDRKQSIHEKYFIDEITKKKNCEHDLLSKSNGFVCNLNACLFSFLR